MGNAVGCKNTSCTCRHHPEELSRRAVLKTALALGVALPWLRPAPAAALDVTIVRPQRLDRLVYAFGEKAGQVISTESMEIGVSLVIAYPMDPVSSVIRSGSRFNQILLLRLDPADLTEETRQYAADGVVAYSAVCTHLGCPLSGWFPQEKVIKCWCHGSVFDPKDYGRVLDGPAPKRLAILPLAVNDGALIAAGEFLGKVGFFSQA